MGHIVPLVKRDDGRGMEQPNQCVSLSCSDEMTPVRALVHCVLRL